MIRSSATGQPDSRRGTGMDATTILTVYVVFLTAIPSQLVIGPLGGAGTPAQVMGLACLVWWTWERIRSSGATPGSAQPVRRVAVVWVIAILLAFVNAMLRPISQVESSTAILGLLSVSAWLGVLLVANDGIPSIRRLNRIVTILTWAGTFLALLGLLQFVTHQPFTNYIHVPGLTLNQQLYGSLSRDGFTRPSGTAVHPIEFGAVLTMILPFAIYRAVYSRDIGAIGRFMPSVAILSAVSVSISRSALLCAAVVVVVVLPTLHRAARIVLAAALVILSLLLFVLIPGLVGTISGLFSSISSDPSALSRTDSYGVAIEFIRQSPLFGRGLFTFLPAYRIFDNQYLLSLVEIGVFGLAALLALIGTAIYCAFCAGRSQAGTYAAPLGYAIGAGLASGATGLALFDGFSFPMVPGLLFLLLGLAGSVWRLSHANPTMSRDSMG